MVFFFLEIVLLTAMKGWLFMSDVSFKEIPVAEWEKLPAPVRPTKDDPYAPVIAALQAGKAISIGFESETQLKGIRITLARKARNATPGFVVEFRVNGNTLAARKSDAPIPEKREVKHRTKKEQ